MKKASVGISKHATKANPDLPVEIRAFYVSIHGGKGCSGYGLYRAKLTLFAVSATPAGVHAELYFYDTLEQMMPDDYSQPHYVLTFPIAALAPILDQLRHSTSQVNLVRENHVWRIETTPGEPVRKR